MTKRQIAERDAEWLRLGRQLLQQKSGMRRLGLDPQTYLAYRLAGLCPQWPISLLQAEWILGQLREANEEPCRQA